MTRYRSADWDAIAAATPNDVVAARVVAQGTEEASDENFDKAMRTRVCPRVKTREECPPKQQEKYDRLVGRVFGETTVIGILAEKPLFLKRRYSARRFKDGFWVLRCSCGTYSTVTKVTFQKMVKRFEQGKQTRARCAECQRRDQSTVQFRDFFQPHQDEGSGKGAQADTGLTMEEIVTAWADDAEAGV